MFIDVVSILEDYGWYILITGIILAYTYNKFLKSRFDEYRKDKEEKDYAAKYHKNPDLFNARLQAQEAYVQKLQEKYNKEAEEYQRKQEEKAALKRTEFLEKNSQSGTKLGSKSDESDNKKPGLRSDYNPLMGGSSHNYRPPRRSACGGGGCGR